jgi:hypothetical protein
MDDKTPDIRSVDLAKNAMENYFRFFQKNLSNTPWAGNQLAQKMAGYAQQNVTAAFEFAQQLAHAKDIHDVLSIQTQFFQRQLRSLTEQAKELGAISMNSASAGSDHET